MAGAEASKVDLFGRKIFFLNPAYSVRNEVITELQNEEYEVYIIESYRDAKNLLRLNENAILFINVDAQLAMNSWYNFIRSFEKEDVLSSIYIGIISERIRPADRELFLTTAQIPAGIIMLDTDMKFITESILGVLKEANAKGRRQYVRANLSHDKEASLFWNHGTKMYQLKLLDISSVGMSVKVPPALAQIVGKNFILRDVTLRLGSKQIVIEAVVFAVKEIPDGIMWVLLLLPNTSTKTRDIIRQYVSETFQKIMMTVINNARPDDTAYDTLNYYNMAAKRKNAS